MNIEALKRDGAKFALKNEFVSKLKEAAALLIEAGQEPSHSVFLSLMDKAQLAAEDAKVLATEIRKLS